MSTIIESMFSKTSSRRPFRHTTVCGTESVRGARRDQNEDYVLAEKEAGIFLVADGMGGNEGGAEASELLCAVVAGELMEADTTDGFDLNRASIAMQRGIDVATDGMNELADVCPGMRKMGSTMVGGWIVDDFLYYGHVGDSRIYLLRNKKLTRLTKDHSLVQELCDSGVVRECERGKNQWRYFVTRHVGPSARSSKIDVDCLRIREGDRFIFVTDGITDVLSDETIRRAANIARVPQELCHWLQIAARNADAHDDTSCVVVDFQRTPVPNRSPVRG